MSEFKREGKVVALRKREAKKVEIHPLQTLVEALQQVSTIRLGADGKLATDETEAREKLMAALAAAVQALNAVSEDTSAIAR